MSSQCRNYPDRRRERELERDYEQIIPDGSRERSVLRRVDPSHRRNVLRCWNHPRHPGNAPADTRRREFKTADEVTSDYTETTRDARRRSAKGHRNVGCQDSLLTPSKAHTFHYAPFSRQTFL